MPTARPSPCRKRSATTILESRLRAPWPSSRIAKKATASPTGSHTPAMASTDAAEDRADHEGRAADPGAIDAPPDPRHREGSGQGRRRVDRRDDRPRDRQVPDQVIDEHGHAGRLPEHGHRPRDRREDDDPPGGREPDPIIRLDWSQALDWWHRHRLSGRRGSPSARSGGPLVSSAGSVKRAPSVGAWRSLVARIVRDDEVGGSNPLAPTRLTFFHADDAAPEGRVPASRIRMSGQRERAVGHPQDVRGRLGPHSIGPGLRWLIAGVEQAGAYAANDQHSTIIQKRCGLGGASPSRSGGSPGPCFGVIQLSGSLAASYEHATIQ